MSPEIVCGILGWGTVEDPTVILTLGGKEVDRSVVVGATAYFSYVDLFDTAWLQVDSRVWQLSTEEWDRQPLGCRGMDLYVGVGDGLKLAGLSLPVFGATCTRCQYFNPDTETNASYVCYNCR